MTHPETIRIGRVEVPLLDYAIGGTAILGIRDSGKTVTGKGIAEQLLERGIPIVVFDAVGKWRWMKVPGPFKGKSRGYEIVVAGGRGPDLPLNPQSVSEIVRASLKERIPLIIDLYDPKLSKADWRRVVQTAIRIIHYENEGGPLHVFLEEAAEYVPQKVQDGETYAEVEKFVRMGGNASVGITLINQRSQEVNKAVLDLCTTLVLGCQVGSKAIEAVEKWVDRLDPETAAEVTGSLPKLQSGEAWVWTRQNPDRPSREKIPMCLSLHPDRRTPNVDRELATIAKTVDTAKFVERLAATMPKVVEEAKANDPGELKREIARLKKELAKAPAKSEPEVIRVPLISEDDRTHLFDALRTYERATSTLTAQTKAILDKMAETSRTFFSPKPTPKPAPRPDKEFFNERRQAPAESNGAPTGGLRRMLVALAQCPDGLTAKQIALRAGLSAKSGSFRTYLSTLRRNEWVTEQGQTLLLNSAGRGALGHYEDLPIGRELVEYWVNELGGGAGRMLSTLAGAYPNALSPDELGGMVGMSSGSGSFRTYLSKLKTLGLMERTREGLRLNEELAE